MSFTIGRVGVDTTLNRVREWSTAGGVLTVSFETPYGSIRRAEVLREQILGLTSPDEAFVPVTSTDYPESDGYYRVLSANVATPMASAFAGVYACTVSLERVSGFAAPLIELRRLGAARAVSASVTQTPRRPVCLPGRVRSLAFFNENHESWVSWPVDLVRDTADGSAHVTYLNSLPYMAQFYLAPEHFYEGAATLLMGDQLSPVVGRQVRNLPGAWRLSNGLYEIEPTGSGSFELQHRMWLGSGWSEWVPFMLHSSQALAPRAPVPAPHSITVLRNSPVEVSVRLLAVVPGGNFPPIQFDVSLKRGQRGVGVELRSVVAGNYAVQSAVVPLTLDEAWFVWGDSGGVRHFLGSDGALLTVSGGGVIPYEGASSNVKTWSFTLGATVQADDPMLDHLRSWLWAGSEKQAVVSQ